MDATYLMHGPDLDTGKVVQEQIPASNVPAYKKAGWQMGPIPPPEPDAEPLVIYPVPPPVPEAIPQTMHGIEIGGTKVIQADIEPENVVAYQAAGWELGPIPEEAPEEAPEAEKPVAPKKTKKK